NALFCQTVGYDLAEIQGRHHSMFAEPAVVDTPDYASFWRRLDSGEFDSGEYRRLGKGGREVWLQASYTPVLGAGGKVVKVIKLALDITKAKSYVDGATYDANHVKADLDDLTYDPTLPHRLIIAVGGKQSGGSTQVRSSANLSFDFIPATGKAPAGTDPQRMIVDMASCNQCHTRLDMHANFFPPIHDPKLCVVCHTEQQKYGSADSNPVTGNTLVPAGTYAAYGATLRVMGRALPNFPNMIHHIHQGEGLYYQGYNQFGVQYNEVAYPQDQRNCVKCHNGQTGGTAVATPQGDNWKNVPSRLACGACHDGINFATGGGMNKAGTFAGHIGGAKADDSLCTVCHDATSIEKVYHLAILPPNPINAFSFPTAATCAYPACSSNTNASSIASVQSNLPAGASKVTWLINSVSVSAGVPSMKFKFQKDGQDVVFNNPATKSELMDNFVGGPSIYWAFGAPQDGITKPADWNGTVSIYLKRAWNGTAVAIDGVSKANTFAGPDASGWYTITLTGSKIPLSATMVTGGIGYSYGLG
ncbi:MAG: PAS domain-containing protein, partial [Proteobacteria bacterium]|nr:PAS domain-containing protein [Pseudomonadota bacterium]